MTDRPVPDVSGENVEPELRAHLDRTLPTLREFSGVVGITLNGGLARGYADDNSEIDLTLFLEPKTFDVWQSDQAPLATGITTLDGRLYDIAVENVEQARERDWDPVERWDFSYADVVYDPDDRVAELLAEKLDADAAPPVTGHLFSAWWNFRLAGDIWVDRGDPLQGHFVLNQGVDALLRALFAANDEFVPHEKWLVNFSRSLAWTPPDWEARLGKAMDTGDRSIKSVEKRQQVIGSIWQEVDAYVVRAHYPGLPVAAMQQAFYEPLARLVEAGTVPVEEWPGELDFLNHEPFHTVATVESDLVVLDRDRLLDVTADEMYIWHYEVLDAVR